MKRLTYKRANELLRYEPETGNLFWKLQRGRAAEGSEAGSISRNKGRQPCRHVHIDGHKYGFGPVAWLLVTGKRPKRLVDFKNGNPLDTRWENLVLATYRERNAYALPDADSAVGIAGIDKWMGKYRVRITLGKAKQTQIGLFTNLKEAIAAKRAATPPR